MSETKEAPDLTRIHELAKALLAEVNAQPGTIRVSVYRQTDGKLVAEVGVNYTIEVD